MDFVEFLLGKRLIDDEIARGLEGLSQLPSVKRRRAEATAKAALVALDAQGIRWQPACRIEVNDDGTLRPPRLPTSPGIVRLDVVGPATTDWAVSLASHMSMASEDAHWNSDPELIGQVRAGVRFEVFYALADGSHSEMDLSTDKSRHAAIRTLELGAEASGYWLAHQIDDRRVLILR